MILPLNDVHVRSRMGVKDMYRSISLWITILFVFTGCVYSPTVNPMPTIETVPVAKSEQSAAVGADPFVQRERQKAVFNAELGEVGVLPIQVFVRNDGDRTLWVRPSDITLTLPDGNEIHSSRAAAISALKDPDSAYIIGPLLLFGPVLAIVASSSIEEARSARLKDFQSKEFPDTVLNKNESAHGFVFFVPPREAKSFSNALLNVRLVDNTAHSSFVIQLPLTALDFMRKEVESK